VEVLPTRPTWRSASAGVRSRARATLESMPAPSTVDREGGWISSTPGRALLVSPESRVLSLDKLATALNEADADCWRAGAAGPDRVRR